MAKYIQMVVVLVTISAISGVALGGLNSMTKDIIKKNTLERKKVPAVLSIVKRYAGDLSGEALAQEKEKLLTTNFKELDIGEKEPLLVFIGDKDGKPYTVVIEAAGDGGYGGSVGIVAGFNIETGDLVGLGIGDPFTETPGIGTGVKEDSFLLQFVNMSKDANFSLKKAGGDIDGKSGATKSSIAVADGLSKAKALFDEHRDKIMAAVNQ